MLIRIHFTSPIYVHMCPSFFHVPLPVPIYAPMEIYCYFPCSPPDLTPLCTPPSLPPPALISAHASSLRYVCFFRGFLFGGPLATFRLGARGVYLPHFLWWCGENSAQIMCVVVWCLTALAHSDEGAHQGNYYYFRSNYFLCW